MSRQITGNLNSLNAAVVITIDDPTLPQVGSVAVQLGGPFTGTVSFQATIDGVNWFSVNATPITATGGVPVSSTTAPGQFAISNFGFNQVRAIMTAYVAGNSVTTLDVSVSAVPNSPLISVATQGDNQGGPPLASGLPSLALSASDDDKNFQGSDNVQMIVTAVAGQSFITFLDNPWIQGLTTGAAILLSAAPNSTAVEEVIVGTNNVPSVGTGTFVVQILNPIVNNGSSFATFDIFGVDGPTTVGINTSTPGLTVPGQTIVGVKGSLQLLYDSKATDIKRPIKPWIQAPGNPGVAAVQNIPDAMGANDLSAIRQILEKMIIAQNLTNFLLSQMKDGGAMEVPVGIFPEANGWPN